jgi:hypothetical protein
MSPEPFMLYVQFPRSFLQSRAERNTLERSGCFNRTNTLESSWAGDLDTNGVLPLHKSSPA